jgi:cell shape-determining protein MreD
MRWPIFIIAGYLLMVLQVGLAPHIAIPTRFGPIEPQFVLLLAVFVALSAPTSVAVVASTILGLLLDLTSTYSVAQIDDAGQAMTHAPAVILGPYALGYMAGGYLVVQMRPMLFRQHPMTIATMMLVAGTLVHLVVLAIFTVRRFYEPLEGFAATSELAARAMSLLYSAAVGLVLAYPLHKTSWLFGFSAIKPSARVY